MAIKHLLAAAAALSLATAPTVAAAQSAAPAPATETAKGEELRGGGVFVALLAAIAVILGIIIAINEDDEPVPHTP